MEARSEHEMRRQFNTLWLFNACVGGVMLALTYVWCAHYRGGFAWRTDVTLQFNWHPLLMLFGLLYAQAQSILLYRARRDWPKLRLKRLHAALHITAFVCAVVGLAAVFDYHNRSTPPKPNLYTMHSWLGLSGVILFAAQYVAGFVAFLWPGVTAIRRQMALPLHVATGGAIFVLCVAAALMGFTEKAIWAVEDYAQLPAEGVLVNMIAMLVALFAVVTLHLLNRVEYKRQPLDDDQITAFVEEQSSE